MADMTQWCGGILLTRGYGGGGKTQRGENARLYVYHLIERRGEAR